MKLFIIVLICLLYYLIINFNKKEKFNNKIIVENTPIVEKMEEKIYIFKKFPLPRFT